jgi:glycosyltransferase involved in cell wall biosynthesis
MPKSLLEAMSCGLPCIGTDVTGINEVLTHEDTGFLCNTDPVSLRTAITRVFADEKLRKRLGTSAREHILKTYSLDEVTSAEASVYDEILTN